MAPPVTWLVRALGRATRRLLQGRGRVRALGSGEAEFVVFLGRARVRALGSGEAEFIVFWGRARVRALGSGEAEFVVFRGRARVRALGPGEAELPMAPEAGLGRCQPHSVEWHSSRSDAGSAVFLSGRSVERRSDCGHFGSVNRRACVRIRCHATFALNASATWSVGVAIRPRLLLGGDWASGEPKVYLLLEGGPRARRESSGVGCPCPRLGSGEARSRPLSGLSLDLIVYGKYPPATIPRALLIPARDYTRG
jgi:hypothetical protein